ncbi:10781_t:CDS:2, partial [Cetraspora pellucida]
KENKKLKALKQILVMTHKSYDSEICQKTKNQKENRKLKALKQILVMMHKSYDPEIC